MSEKMNMRQKRFAEFYVQSGNIVKSAISAGYSEKYANSDACKILFELSTRKLHSLSFCH